jgi:type I restriction enzyme S subunit
MSELDLLPEGWAAIKIENIADVKGGKRLPKGESFSDEITAHPYLRVTDFFNETIDMSDLKYLKVDTHQQIENYTISKNDLYISIAGTIGLVGSIPASLDDANLTENAAKICNISGVDKVYLKRFLNSQSAIDQFKDKTTSSGQPKLALFRIRDCDLLLPPLAEQKVIADKLDELLAQVESTKARLDAIPAILKSFRQSVLAAAVSGELTNSDTTYWENTKIDDLVKVVNGKAFPSKDYQENGIRLLKPGNLHMSGVVVWNLKNTTYIPEAWKDKRPELILKEGALLMNLTAQSLADEFLGRVCVFNEQSEVTLLNQRICYFESKLKYDIKPYLYIFFKSPQFRAYVDTLDSGTLIKHLNIKNVKSYTIQLPDELEQTEIVRRVEELFAFADKVEAQVNAAQLRVNNLTQSILAKAFRGELTADWRAANPELISGDNSAEALLKRIKAEREALTKTTKKPAKKA